jgi:hypothetical protein
VLGLQEEEWVGPSGIRNPMLYPFELRAQAALIVRFTPASSTAGPTIERFAGKRSLYRKSIQAVQDRAASN